MTAPFHESYWSAVAGIAPALLIANVLVWERAMRFGAAGLFGRWRYLWVAGTMSIALSALTAFEGVISSLSALQLKSDRAATFGLPMAVVTNGLSLSVLATMVGPMLLTAANVSARRARGLPPESS